MTLSQAHTGDYLRIEKINDPEVRASAIRFGIYEGAEVYCLRSIRKGPVVLQNSFQETAVGRNLAERIEASMSESRRSA